MDRLKELQAMGAQLSLEGEKLHAFISAQQETDRMERAAIRDEQARARELEARAAEDRNRIAELQLQLDLTKQKAEEAAMEEKHRAVDFERESRLIAQKAEEAEREHKRKMELLALQTKGQQTPTTDAGGSQHNYVPKLPPFEDGKDDIDAYLRRFETFATSQKWERDRWAVSLSTLLKGRALEVFSRLATEQALNYDNLKEALLRRFDFTEDGFRKRFRTSRSEQSETVTQFAARLQNYFARWLDLARCPITFDGVRDLVIREQVMNCCSNELRLYLRERTPSTLNELTTLADKFVEARGGSARNFLLQRQKEKPLAGSNPSSNTSATTSQSANVFRRQCFVCGSDSHLAAKCPKSDRTRKQKSGAGAAQPWKLEAGNSRMKSPNPAVGGIRVPTEDREPINPVTDGYVNDTRVKVLRDSGCEGGIVVRRALVKEPQMLKRTQDLRLLDGTVRRAPIASVPIKSPYFTGTYDVWCIDNPIYDVIIGNVPGAKPPNQPECHKNVAAVETRGQRSKPAKGSLSVPVALKDKVTKDELVVLQQNDPTLVKIRELSETERVRELNGVKTNFCVNNQLRYRKVIDRAGRTTTQLVVPQKLRETVLRLAHDSLMAGHQGIARTTDRILTEFFWPGCRSDIERYCKSCDICQRTVHRGRVGKVPLGDMPLVSRPFEKVAVDLIGPLIPASDRGYRYILTLVDCATRYPEAIPLKRIETEDVAEALVEIFSRVGVPRELLSDRGSQFTSHMFAEVSRLLSLRCRTTTPYHPAANGLVERFNGTLKQMLKRMCTEKPKDWDRYVSALLFAYREVPQESTGFAPFELIYGHHVRGPLRILKELWTKSIPDPEVKTAYQYVVDLKERLEHTCELAHRNLQSAKFTQAKQYNRRAKARNMDVGQKVLILRPVKHNKLQLQWRGPYKILQKIGEVDYQIEVDGKAKTYHANLLRLYQERDSEPKPVGILSCASIAVIHDSAESGDGQTREDHLSTLLSPQLEATERVEDVNIAPDLTQEQSMGLKAMLQDFSGTFTDLPGHTSLTMHSIHTTTDVPVRVKPYPAPHHMKETIRKELDKMLEMDIVETSESDYSAPVVLIRKRDGSCRFCLDYRQLNKVCVFDAEPMPSVEDLFVKLAGCRYYSKIDLSKGYWQVPLDDDAKRKSAFSTPFGLFQFKRMSFGLMCAPATFSRLMRKLLKGLDGLDNFLDDILVFSRSWEDHLVTLKALCVRLKNANLTARPSKCFFGYTSLECLGHVIGNDSIQPTQEKMDTILAAPQPVTKKQVRSFMGLANYYRKFIPNFATIAVPITDLTKKGMPNKVMWSEPQENAFVTLKRLLTSNPILRLPNLEKRFTLRTDASDTGLGAMLLQDCDERKHPVAYASRKLLPRERRYSVIEKECLGLVWGVDKFAQYLLGRDFDVETDHQPLTCLAQKNVANSRIMRWALLLQPYRMTIKAIPGRENVGADYLSRLDV